MKSIEAGKLPSSWSAQCCEIYALKKGLERLNGKKGTIYIDSKYAYGVVHAFGKIWLEQGYLNSKEKALIHENLIKEILKALQGPDHIAIVHIKGHQKGSMREIKGNALADQEAKCAALSDERETTEILVISDDIREKEEGLPSVTVFTQREKTELEKEGMKKGLRGNWRTLDNRQILNKALARRVMQDLHASTQVHKHSVTAS